MPPNFAALLGKGGKAPAAPSIEVEVGGEDESPKRQSVVSAAQDLLDAIAAKDVAGVADALEAAHSACGGEEE